MHVAPEGCKETLMTRSSAPGLITAAMPSAETQLAQRTRKYVVNNPGPPS